MGVLRKTRNRGYDTKTCGMIMQPVKYSTTNFQYEYMSFNWAALPSVHFTETSTAGSDVFLVITVLCAPLEEFGAVRSFLLEANFKILISSMDQQVYRFGVLALENRNSAQGLYALRFT